MTKDELIARMQGRVDLCRRLASSTTDPRTANILRQIAEEGERDIEAIEAQQGDIVIQATASG